MHMYNMHMSTNQAARVAQILVPRALSSLTLSVAVPSASTRYSHHYSLL